MNYELLIANGEFSHQLSSHLNLKEPDEIAMVNVFCFSKNQNPAGVHWL